MAYKTIEVLVNKLFLDKTNSRHEPLDNEPEIIERLLKKEKADRVAKSIAEVGDLNPLERIGVIAHPDIKGGYVVIEGNRRVCALKMLHDPDKAPKQLQNRVLEYKQKGRPIPTKVDVVLFDTEAEAEPWITMRHEGEQDGVGTRQWTPEGKARQAAKVGGQNANHLAISVLGYATKRGLLNAAETESIPATTITRYLGNPIMRHALGLSSGKALEIDVPTEQFDTAIEVFLRDALPIPGKTSKVHSRSKAADWKAYAESLSAGGHAPTTRLKKPVALKAVRGKESSKKTRLSNPDNRSSIVDASFRYSFSSDPILSRVFRELRGIDASTFGFAAGYLLRAFVERLAHNYAKKYRLGKDGDLHLVIDRCVKHLEKNTTLITKLSQKGFNSAIQPLRTMVSDKHNRLSPDTLGSWVHGSSVPTRAELNRRWESMAPGLKLLADGM